MSIDPAAETARWLATISPEDLERAVAYTRGGHWLLLWGAIVSIVVAWLIIPMVLALTFEVVSRYLFNAPTLWAYDMTFMLYGSFFMLGAAFTLQRRGHVRSDSCYADWSPRRQARVNGWSSRDVMPAKGRGG